MKGTVKIGGKDVGMVANAASPYIYKQIFHEDFLQKLQASEPETDLFQRMGFVMAKQYEMSELSDLMKLSEEDFFGWLMGFESMDIIYATEDIADIYLAQQKATVVPKSEGE